jgi:hypothetical protein
MDALTQFAAYKCAFWTHDVCELGAEFCRDATDDDSFLESQRHLAASISAVQQLLPRLEATKTIMLQNPVRIEKGRSSGMVPSSCHHTVAQSSFSRWWSHGHV